MADTNFGPWWVQVFMFISLTYPVDCRFCYDQFTVVKAISCQYQKTLGVGWIVRPADLYWLVKKISRMLIKSRKLRRIICNHIAKEPRNFCQVQNVNDVGNHSASHWNTFSFYYLLTYTTKPAYNILLVLLSSAQYKWCRMIILQHIRVHLICITY